MKVSCRFAIFFALLVSLSALASPPAGYYLVWSDEFNGTSLDPTKWWVWNQADRSGFTTPAAVTEGGGYLTLHTYSTNGLNYSPIISSDGLFRERYGYSEASIEFNGSPGMFSDFWIQSAVNGEIIGNPSASGVELDVCEHRVTDASNIDNISGYVTIDLHWNGYGSSEKSINGPLVDSGLGTGFHTYGLLWSHTNYTVNIDGTQMWTSNTGISDRTEIIMLSSEVDSNSFCGIVPPGGYGNFNVSTTSTVVDYVRFYAPTTTLYWLGTSSANWSDTGNWLSNMAPTSASDAVFCYLSKGNFNVNFPQSTTVNSLSVEETPTMTFSGGPLTVNGGGIDMLSATANSGINAPLVVGAAQTWSVGPGYTLVLNTTVTGSGNVTLQGPGTVQVAGTNNFSGTMLVNNGTLLNGEVVDDPVTVQGGTAGGTGIYNGAVTINSGTFTGNGTINAPVAVNANGTLEPGSPYGPLTVNNTVTLGPGSFTWINLNKSTGSTAQITGATGIVFGGTLIVSNLGGAFAAGDSFNVFNAASYSGAFNRITPATPGAGLVWDTSDLAASGVLRVISPATGSITAQNTTGFSATPQITLSWPAGNLGWILQAQTNPPGAGITSNWVTVAGSQITNLLAITVNSNIGSVFYRLVSPSFSTALFAPGDLIVLQVGNGSIASAGTPGVIEEFSPFGGAVLNQVSLPTSGASSLIFGGSSYDGALSLSADGHDVVIPGYNVAIGSAGSDADTSSTTGGTPVPRAVGLMAFDGTFSIGAMTKQFSGATIRSAVADGNGNFWAGGGNSGVIYLGSNSPAATVSSYSSSTREIGLMNGNIYFSESSTTVGVMGFNGTPTAAASPAMVLNTGSLGSGPSPKGFVISAAAGIAYVIDNRAAASGGGAQRFNWNGSAWVYAYTIGNTLTSSDVLEDAVVDFSGASPVIYGITGETTGNHLVKCTDTGSGSSFTSLEFATSGNAFRGVVFAPTQ